MKKMRIWMMLVVVAALVALAFVTPAWAAETVKSFKSLVGQAVENLIPLYAPLLLILLKKGLEGVPPIILPGLAISVGIFGQALSTFLTGNAIDPIWGGSMGAMGVVVRDFVVELQDFAKGAKK